MAPKGTPADVLDKLLHTAAQKALEDPELKLDRVTCTSDGYLDEKNYLARTRYSRPGREGAAEGEMR